MYRKDIEKKHYFLGITFSLFILLISSLVMFKYFSNNITSDYIIKEIDYGKIDNINPLVIHEAEKNEDKTAANISVINEIKRVYNIDVIYGDGTELLVNSVEAKAIYNEQEVNRILLELIDSLEKYPNNIFKEIQLEDYDIEICLVEYFKNDNVALATRDSNNNFKIYLSNTDENLKVTKSIHHEMYHILEYYMKLEFDINEIYKEWNKYNPEGFMYEENIALLDKKFVFGLDKDAYFVSVYSKVSEKEDRAEVFADTMSAENMPSYYYDDIGAIKNKMLLISGAIKNSFNSINNVSLLHWTRFFR